MGKVGRYEEPDDAAISPEQAAAKAEILSTRASVPTPFKLFLASPKLALLLAPVGEHLVRNSSLTRRETEIGILVTAERIGSDFVLAAHTNTCRREGIAEDVIQDIRKGARPTLPDVREQLVRDLAASMHDDGAVPRDLYDRAVASIGDQGIADLAGLRGFYVCCASVLRAHDVTPPALVSA